MAAITLASLTRPQTRRYHVIRTGAAQADTGQTDWFYTPRNAAFATVYFALTAAAGTTPVTNITVKGAEPSLLDDAYSFHVGGTTLTAQNTTATSGLLQVIEIGPSITGIADDLILGATGVNRAAINAVIPTLMGIGLAFDRTSANETYTYTLSVEFRPFVTKF